MKFLPDRLRKRYLDSIDPVVKLLIRLGIHPNHLTTLGLLIQIFTVYFLATGKFLVGGVLILISGTCDTIDGKIARTRGAGTKFGALYDSTLDRYSEFLMFLGIAFYFVQHEQHIYSVVTFLALGGSLMTSYIRARSEALGMDCKVGSMQRAERIVYVGIASVFSGIPRIAPYPLIFALVIIAIMSNYTAFQRLVHVYKLTNRGRDLLVPEENEKRL